MPGDVFVSLNTNDDEIGTEGYVLEIGVDVTIRAHTAAGVFYGSRSLMQILVAGHSSLLPHGRGRDFPQYAERGFMLDVSSQFVPINLLKRYVRYLAWYKYNDFQLELSDNGGFRLNSPAFPGLAAKDGSYTESQFKDLETYALARGISVTPEIDSPGHAAALTRYRPELANPKNGNFLNLARPQTDSFMASLWSAFLPWFTGPRIAIGADEYDTADGDSYRRYVNFLDSLLRQHGKSVRMWGSLSREWGDIPVRTDITVQEWDTAWSDPMAMDQLGFPIINASSEFLYIVTPKTPWFADRIDTRNLYERWEPTIFSRTDRTLNMLPGDSRLQGAMFDFWGDGATQDAFNRVQAAMPVVGEKLWNDASAKVAYRLFNAAVKSTGEVPKQPT
jgi:hexosaminidase